MKNKLIAAFLVIVMAVTQLGAFAFSDMAEERFSWAVEAVEAMAEKGIINGYPDGTFQPDNGITKIEAILLISRILGINDDVYSDSLEDIYSIYKEDLKELDLQYENEIAFLLDIAGAYVIVYFTLAAQNGYLKCVVLTMLP